MLRYLLTPVSPDQFTREYLERRPLHVPRNDPAYATAIYSLGDLEDSLVTGAGDPQFFSLVKSGVADLPPSAYTMERLHPRARMTGRPPEIVLDVRSIVRHFTEGCTIVVKDAARFCAKLQRATNALIADLGSYAQPNAYLTPPGSQGFAAHYDTHDTLIVQIDGEKRWRIYAPVVELPTELQPCPERLDTAALTHVQDVHLQAGDTLYLPRGFVHEAATSASSALHITFALAPVRTADVLDHFDRLRSEREIGLRRSLDASGAETVLHSVTADNATVADAIEAAYDWMFRAVRPQAEEAFAQAARLAELTDETPLQYDERVPFMLRPRGDGIALLVAGKVIPLPSAFAPALERLKRGATIARELDPALPVNHRNLLIRILVIEGVVRINGF
jgi:hypothetical protein